MDIQTKKLEGAQESVEVILQGRLDIQGSEAVKTTLHQIVASSAAVAVVNLNEVHFIDSAGLSALVSGLRRAKENEKDIVLVGLNKQAKMIFQLTMLDRIFTIHPSMGECVDFTLFIRSQGRSTCLTR